MKIKAFLYALHAIHISQRFASRNFRRVTDDMFRQLRTSSHEPRRGQNGSLAVGLPVQRPLGWSRRLLTKISSLTSPHVHRYGLKDHTFCAFSIAAGDLQRKSAGQSTTSQGAPSGNRPANDRQSANISHLAEIVVNGLVKFPSYCRAIPRL